MCKEKEALASRFPLFVDPVFKLRPFLRNKNQNSGDKYEDGVS